MVCCGVGPTGDAGIGSIPVALIGFIALLCFTSWGISTLSERLMIRKGLILNCIVREVKRMRIMNSLVTSVIAVINTIWAVGASVAAGLLLSARLHNFQDIFKTDDVYMLSVDGCKISSGCYPTLD